MDEESRLFGEDRLWAVLAGSQDTPSAVVDRVHAAVLTHRGAAAQSDDITMLCFVCNA